MAHTPQPAGSGPASLLHPHPGGGKERGDSQLRLLGKQPGRAYAFLQLRFSSQSWLSVAIVCNLTTLVSLVPLSIPFLYEKGRCLFPQPLLLHFLRGLEAVVEQTEQLFVAQCPPTPQVVELRVLEEKTHPFLQLVTDNAFRKIGGAVSLSRNDGNIQMPQK